MNFYYQNFISSTSPANSKHFSILSSDEDIDKNISLISCSVNTN